MKNQTGKYFKYAIGEILLVVIGILIAVQINTWNQHRLAKSKETKILTQLNIDLRENLTEIKGIKESIIKHNISGQSLLNHLDTSNQITDSLKYWVEVMRYTSIFNNANTTYKNLENSNDNIISNDSIRLQVTLMYEVEFANIHIREENLYDEVLRVYKSEVQKNFKTSPIIDKWLDDLKLAVNTPINLSDLKQNDAFKNSIVNVFNYRVMRLRWLNTSIKKLDTLITTIDEEIINLES